MSLKTAPHFGIASVVPPSQWRTANVPYDERIKKMFRQTC